MDAAKEEQEQVRVQTCACFFAVAFAGGMMTLICPPLESMFGSNDTIIANCKNQPA
ncbi:MAG: hypothetical protein LUE92_12000 [Clostridiales bacterium]|nr:hypothetical protein [Clostridiales bacterium]